MMIYYDLCYMKGADMNDNAAEVLNKAILEAGLEVEQTAIGSEERERAVANLSKLLEQHNKSEANDLAFEKISEEKEIKEKEVKASLVKSVLEFGGKVVTGLGIIWIICRNDKDKEDGRIPEIGDTEAKRSLLGMFTR